jgi:hypothetical protein
LVSIHTNYLLFYPLIRVFNFLNRHLKLCIDIQNKMLNSNLINFVRASHWTKRCVKEKSEREKYEFEVKTDRVIRERGRVRISEQEETFLLQQNIFLTKHFAHFITTLHPHPPLKWKNAVGKRTIIWYQSSLFGCRIYWEVEFH